MLTSEQVAHGLDQCTKKQSKLVKLNIATALQNTIFDKDRPL